ncbi:cupin domain-containing protein [Streptomyces sp. NPDC002587]
MAGQQAMTIRPTRSRAGAGTGAREVVIPPGGCTGWHYHRVRLNAVVLAGTLTRVLHDRSVVVHRAGAAFVEPAGIRHIHLGHNLGSEPVVIHVTPALPAGTALTPFSIPAPAPAGITPAVCREHAA